MDILKSGETTFKEKELDKRFLAALDGGIKFTTEYQVADAYIFSVQALHASTCDGQVVTTDIKTAEMDKVIENTFRCVNIAFTNELAKICCYNGMGVYGVIKICNMHSRVNILNPGPGVGGHCIPVDFLVSAWRLSQPEKGGQRKP